MNINIRMEGGLGDHLLANRFVPAILDKYPRAKIKIFSDTEGNDRSLNTILDLFGNFYARKGEVIQERQNKDYMITTQFGTENYPAHINNQKPEILQKMMDCDKFYDLHIDGLKWLDADFDWLRYYYFFPKPQKIFSNILYEDKYIMAHLYARPDSPYNLDQSYCIELLNKIAELSRIIVIVENKYKDYYIDVVNNPKIIIDTSNTIKDIFNIDSQCSAFIGIDSGIRYIPYHYSKPTFVFSNYCQQYGDILHSHLIRWLLFSRNVFPTNLDIKIIQQILSNVLLNTISHLHPEILSNIDKIIVRRNK